MPDCSQAFFILVYSASSHIFAADKWGVLILG